MSKCYTMEARKFEERLEELGITFNQLREVTKAYNELTEAGRAEVNNLLRTYEDEPNPSKSKRELKLELDKMLKNFGYWVNDTVYCCVMQYMTKYIDSDNINKAEVKKGLDMVLRGLGFYSKASIYISLMEFVDAM